jgi:hypothetical protein
MLVKKESEKRRNSLSSSLTCFAVLCLLIISALSISINSGNIVFEPEDRLGAGESSGGGNEPMGSNGTNPPIHLSKGWNLVSFPYVVSDSSIENILGSISGQYDAVQAYNSTDIADPWKHYNVNKPGHLNDLNHLDNTMGFWIYINDPSGADLVVDGDIPTIPTDIPLNAGWNLVGLPRTDYITVAEVRSGLTGPITVYESNPFGDPLDLIILDFDNVMSPENGFWMHSPVNQIWTVVDEGDPPPDIEILYGFGNFTYNDDGDNTDRPVNVYYYRPDNFPNNDSKVIFTMHGSARDAVSARDRIVPYADRYNALLIAPEFSTDYYPDADDYNRGFVKDGGGTGNLRARSDWTFLSIEEIFDIVLEEIPGAPTKYGIQGNSGAGQFISRLPLLVPEARFEVAAGSNNGWYTLPVRNESYPNGIEDLNISDAQIEQVYSKKVVTVVGENDTDPYSYQLKHNDWTDAQGFNRYERALYYHNYMYNDSVDRGVAFNWDLIVVENVGHAAELMAHATAGAVFANATTPADMEFSPIDDTYIDESYPSDVFGGALELSVDGGNQEIAFLKFDLSSVAAPQKVAMLKLYISKGSTGQQFVHEVADNTWTESNLTWNIAPPLGDEIGMTTGGEKNSILYVEVTDYINGKIGCLASLAIQSQDTESLRFNSSEAANFPAQLVLFA